MKTFLKVVGFGVLAVLALVAGGLAWLNGKQPAQRAASAEAVERTPERVARGEYLTHHVSDCFGCHSDHLTTFGFPVKPGTLGMGGFIFDEKLGFPGVVAAQNITPDPETGLGKWTDGEILRAMREGVDKNGQALFPMMPYEHLRNLSDEDAMSIVAYLRTIPAVRNQVPAKHLNFPVNFIVKFIPKPLTGPVASPDRKDPIAYGKYLTEIGGCYECHTPHKDKGGPIPEQAFSGGWEMAGPWGRNITANLTPHPDTFIGRATKEEFIGRFRAFASMDATNAPVAPAGRNTIMPWLAFSKMTDEDLSAIYDYLKTVKPIEHKVNAFPDAKG